MEYSKSYMMIPKMNRLLFITLITASLISCQTPEKIENIVVIGGGLMGSATGWELSKYGEDVLLIEQQDSIYTYGSSLGEARISRSLGPKNDIFSYLQRTSITETEKLIQFLNETEGNENHKIEDIYRTSPVTYIRYKSQKDEMAALLTDQTVQYEFAPNKEKAAELFGMDIPDSIMIIREYKKHSGTLNPQALITKLHQGIKYAGNQVLYNEKVSSLKRVNEHFEIQLTNQKTGVKRTLLSKKVVSAAGPYNGELLKDVAPYVSELITPKRLFLAFFKIKKAVYENWSAEYKKRLQDFYPVADIDSEIFYSMIEGYDEDGSPIIKVGGHYLRTDIEDLDQVWKKELTTEEIEWSKTNTIDYLNMLAMPLQASDLEFHKGYSCVYSLTKSEVPYVSNIIKNESDVDPNLVLIGGMSGIGAKGSLTYGLMAANLLLDKDDKSPLYQAAKAALGSDRLIKDIQQKDDTSIERVAPIK
jgi:glycine/D-amino acid oxidase-like deaminating enzyme